MLQRKEMSRIHWLEVLGWRNDPVVYEWNRTNKPISEYEHMAWFDKRIPRMKKEPIFSYFSGDDFIGMARLDWVTADTYEVSLIINPFFRSKGHGKKILFDVCEFFSTEFPQQAQLTAVVHSANIASQRLFLRNNFEYKSEHGNFRSYVFRRNQSELST